MKLSAFTFIRNADKLSYPVRESILSVLPLVDEFVIAVDQTGGDVDGQHCANHETAGEDRRHRVTHHVRVSVSPAVQWSTFRQNFFGALGGDARVAEPVQGLF